MSSVNVVSFVLWLGLLSAISQAGVQGVGKGGGFGEMQAIYANLKMSELTQICFGDSNLCDLSLEEKKAIRIASTLSFDLIFDPSCGEDRIIVTSQNQARVSSCRLYLTDTISGVVRVQPFNEIASLILVARLMVSQGDTESAARALSEKIFSSLKQTTHSLAVSLGTGNYLIHANHLEFGPRHQFLLSIEGLTTTIDISPLAYGSLECGLSEVTNMNVLLGSATSFDDHTIFGEAQVNWTCGNGNRFLGTMQMFLDTKDFEVIDGAIQIRVVARHSL